jgi:putative hydrolase of the HAD superfamily
MKLQFNAIIFDLGGVILNIDYNKTIEAFKNLGILDFNTIYTQAQQNNIFDDIETGNISPQDFRDYIKSKSEIELTNQDIDNAWNSMLSDLPARRIKLLKDLGQKYPIYLYSNTNKIHLDAFRKIIGNQYGNSNLLETLFIKTYYSHELQMRKPNANGFKFILKENNLNAQSTLFIDDSKQHIDGANKIGLQTLWLNEKDITEIF